MNQTPPVPLSLAIPFIHKPKISLRQPIGWESVWRKKTACSRRSQWEACSTLSPALSHFHAPSLTLSYFCSLPLPCQCITAVKTTARLKRTRRRNKGHISGWEGSMEETRSHQSGLHLLQVILKLPEGQSLKWWLSSNSAFKPGPSVSYFVQDFKTFRCTSSACRWQGKALLKWNSIDRLIGWLTATSTDV